MKYLLDTHALVWLLSSQDSRLPVAIRESVRYCEDAFFVSEMTLTEIIQLQQGSRINLKYRPSTVRSIIEDNNIMIIPVSNDILEKFFELPVPTINGSKHADPFDRILISTALKRDMTLVSADRKFPWYRDNCGLQLLVV